MITVCICTVCALTIFHYFSAIKRRGASHKTKQPWSTVLTLLSLCLPAAAAMAKGVYQALANFLREAFDSQVPSPQTLWDYPDHSAGRRTDIGAPTAGHARALLGEGGSQRMDSVGDRQGTTHHPRHRHRRGPCGADARPDLTRKPWRRGTPGVFPRSVQGRRPARRRPVGSRHRWTFRCYTFDPRRQRHLDQLQRCAAPQRAACTRNLVAGLVRHRAA